MAWKSFLGSLLLALSVLSMGLSAVRASQPGEMIVICGANGPETIALDASGQPAEPFGTCHCKLCTECVFAPCVALPGSVQHSETLTCAEIGYRPGPTKAVLAARPVMALARGPPTQIELNVPL